MKISNYTNIPHDNLLKVLYGKIEFSFKGRYGAKWAEKTRSLSHFLQNPL